jgi:DNA primase
MSGRIPRDFINDILTRVDIVDLIDSQLPLKKAGANYVARCPFHTEKSPSFSVSRNKQMFHCFGCGASGNAIGFLMDFNNLDFVEAVEDLAAFLGLDVPREQSNYTQDYVKPPQSTEVYEVMEQVARYYAGQLRGNEKAIEYLKNRGITGECAKDFMLGYAPTHWRDLLKHFDQQALFDGGILGRSDNGELYSRFRGRLMFPIRDKRARVIGFGGRVLDDSLPKYLNSPETALFNKGKEVYGLYELLQKNNRPTRIIIVEGYMDVIALAQFGITHAVAVLGTASSSYHLNLLFRFTSEIVFCFDGDNAGQTAAWRAMDAVFASIKDGRSCRFMTLPAKHDPDSLIRELGVNQFNEQISTATPLSDYFFNKLTQGINLNELEAQANLINQAKPYIEKLPDSIFKDMMLERLKKLSGLNNLNIETVSLQPSKHQKPQGRPTLPRLALALLVQHPELIEIIEQRDIRWECLTFEGSEKFNDILQTIRREKPLNSALLLECYRDHPDEHIIRRLEALPLEIPEDGIKAEFSGTLKKLIAQSRDTHRQFLLHKLKTTGLTPQESQQLQKLLNSKSIS